MGCATASRSARIRPATPRGPPLRGWLPSAACPPSSPRAEGVTARPGRVVISEAGLAARVAALGAEIARDYRGLRPIIVGVLRGALVFTGDLARAIGIDLEIEVIGVSSYAGTETSGRVRITSGLEESIDGRHVLLVEDIVDTGLTVAALRRTLAARGPASLKVCALLDKRARRRVDVRVDYVGFAIEDVYVVGYGLDHEGLYRNLPYVAALEDV